MVFCPVTNVPLSAIGLNQQIYQRLKLSLGLNLRRQIFIAVCDDLNLRDRLAAALQAEIRQLEMNQFGGQSYPRLVSLQLSLDDPNPLMQIAQWLTQSPPPCIQGQQLPMPAFQIVGVEHLTRQPLAVQRLFFTHLQAIERNLPLLDFSLLIWMTQPWFHAVSHSAPEFWRCRTGIFEFAGDPTPLTVTSPERFEAQLSRFSTATTPANGTSAPPQDDRLQDEQGNPWMLLEDDLEQLYEPLENLPTAPNPHLEETQLDDPLPAQEEELAQDLVSQDSVSQDSVRDDSPADRSIAPLQIQLPSGLAEQPQFKLLLEQIERLHQQQASPLVLAEAYRTLGNAFRDRIEQGEATPQNLVMAIQVYEQTLLLLSETSPICIDVLNDLGNLYWMLSRALPSSAEALSCLQQGIQSYQQALQRIDPAHKAQTYPMVQNNLGAAYADLARHQEPVENLERSIQSYQQALRYRKPDTDPLRYASTQNNLGTTYWNLAQYKEPVANLKQAIVSYSEALRYYNPEQEPINYAMIQNNLGTAYWNVAQHERPQNWLKLAVAAYKSALQYRTMDAAPSAYAATQNNLGTAYWHIANQTDDPAEKVDCLQQAIVAYEAALQAAADLQQRQPNVPLILNFDRFATHNNLGIAHYQIATESLNTLDASAQSTHLQAALNHHVQAEQGWQGRDNLRQTALNCIIQTIRATYSQLGVSGQNIALSGVPGHLLPEILPKL
ncbi:tetratricopeptide repeat protein [filamentous cyanobacterium CCP1]|nr:tetratricopeptide repeat protein [filamentous cyanobacterium CCP2]PSB61673.1 tetratricopeptide repeat protein [filamentous cyanobacterium CCP1]